jgi:hypothetical protein
MEDFETLIGEVRHSVNNIEETVKTNLKKYEDKLRKLKHIDSDIERYVKEYQDVIVKLNVGGKLFSISVPKLLSVKDSLFNNLFFDNKELFIKGEEFFIDRNPEYFKNIIDYLVMGHIQLPKTDPQRIYNEFKYFNINNAFSVSKEANVVDVIDYEISNQILRDGHAFGLTDLDDLKDDVKETAFCCNANGHIIFELEDMVKVSRINMRGVTVNDNIWSPSSGQKGNIYSSTNKINWTKISKVPKNYGRAICTLKCTAVEAKYLKFSHTGNLGIGHLKVYFDD